MDQSAEMSSSDMSAIRHQMDETRSALTEKLEKLEQKVTDTVQGAAQSVGDTVENVKHALEDTVQNVTSSVHNVTNSVRDTMHSVGEAFNVSHHVERHPWAMVAGATAVGFVGGYILMNKGGDARADEKFRHLSASQGHVPASQYDSPPRFMSENPPTRMATPATTHDMRSSGHTNAFKEWLKPAATQVQSLAVGAALGLVRDMLVRSVPKPMTSQITELVDGLTQSLGGQVIRGSLLDQLPGSTRQS
jgi:ElaB/YqjD/DUF883 family membrane-anchored ribosome-binding protein